VSGHSLSSPNSTCDITLKHVPLPSQTVDGDAPTGAYCATFVTQPYILLIDDPFGSLDAQIRWISQEELLKIWSDHKNLVIFVTHDIKEAVCLATVCWC